MLEKLFPHDPKVRWILIAFISAFLLSFVLKCRAADLELEVGATAVRGNTPVLGLTLEFPGAGPKGSDYDCGFYLIGQVAGDSSQAALQCQLVSGFKALDLGLGIAVMQNEDKFNSGRLQFSLLLGWRITDRIAIKWRHFSNAGTQYPNLGRDLLLLGYRF